MKLHDESSEILRAFNFLNGLELDDKSQGVNLLIKEYGKSNKKIQELLSLREKK